MENQQKMKSILKLLMNEIETESSVSNLKLTEEQLAQRIYQKLDELNLTNQRIYSLLVSSTKGHLTVDEAAEYLSISKSDLYKRTSQGTLKFKKPGKHIYFLKKDLDEYIVSSPQK
ncbi:MAG: helix-turn-helix domain-containing protein [Bacteroidales bacterium]|jgi:excisionase family DNA binding protein|nr:helix-turn-helix domain-containing protein [Bacteroidales bacterium]